VAIGSGDVAEPGKTAHIRASLEGIAGAPRRATHSDSPGTDA
jgi:hypothetical protein